MITYYELVELDHDGDIYVSFGKFSTVEKAEEFKSRFKGLDGFGISEEDLAIQKVEFELDKVDGWVLKSIESCKEFKEECLKKWGERS